MWLALCLALGVQASSMDLLAARRDLSPSNDNFFEKRAVSAKAMKLVANYQGKTFFNNFDFFTAPDPTHGQVTYVSQSQAMSKKQPLAYVNAAGNAIMKVDSTTWLASGAPRNSVRITSKQTFNKGQLLVLDAKHIPTGCTTWPAFWTVGTNWPAGGEIDIVEGTNTGSLNQYTLHTNDGCTTKTPMKATGTILASNCYAYANGNTGCGVQDMRTASFGPGFNARNGGVYATLFNDDGIKMWFWPSNSVPWDLRRARPVPSNWGEPVASFDSSTCDMDTFFAANQTIVINTTLNGDWAGAVYSAAGCPGSASDYVANPSHYKQAYWEISSVRMYQ